MNIRSPLLRLATLVSFAAVAGSVNSGYGAPYQTPQFTPDVTHRTNLCERQKLLRSGDIEFLDVLRGLNLSVVLPSHGAPGWINYDEKERTFSKDYPGYHIHIDLLDELSSRAGFSWRNSYGTFDAFDLPNATRNELIVWLVNAYDFSFTEWNREIERMQMGIDFPVGFSDSSTILIARNIAADEKSSFDVFSFMQPFKWTVWISILGTIIFTGIIYRWVSKTYSLGQRTMKSCDEDVQGKVPGVNIFYAALTATGHLEFSPVTYGERILVFSLCFWSLVVAATYTANLASVMISKNHPIYPATTMAEAEYKGVSVCVTKGLAIASKLKNAYPNANIIEIEGFTLMYEHLFDGKCSLVADTANLFEVRKLNGTLNPDCSLEWVGRAVDFSSAGPINIVDAGIYCTSLVGHVFEYYLKDMLRDGFKEKAEERYVRFLSTHSCPEEVEIISDAEESFQLTMVDMGGIFLVHGIACVLGLLISCMQRCGRKTKDNSSTMHHNEINIADGSTHADDEGVNMSGESMITSRPIGSGVY